MPTSLLPTIKALWVGAELSQIEQLALASFVACGHRIELFTYDAVKNVPSGVITRDGNDIIPRDKVFRCVEKGSYGAFSDGFRYTLLHREGGIWVDTDVVCLKPLDIDAELIFGKEEVGKFNCAVLGGSAGHPLFEFMLRQANAINDPLPYDNWQQRRRKFKRRMMGRDHPKYLRWGEIGPLGVTRAIYHMSLENFAQPYTAFYPIHPKCWDAIFDDTYPDPSQFFPNTYAIHLWNEMLRSKSTINKNGPFPENSLIAALLRRYL